LPLKNFKLHGVNILPLEHTTAYIPNVTNQIGTECNQICNVVTEFLKKFSHADEQFVIRTIVKTDIAL
jgi:hypothetical protein